MGNEVGGAFELARDDFCLDDMRAQASGDKTGAIAEADGGIEVSEKYYGAVDLEVELA